MFRCQGLLFILLLFLSYSELKAQFTISGEIRPRFEFRDGYKQLPEKDENPAAHISQRSRLLLDYQHEKLSTCFSIQDVRIWGSKKTISENPDMALHQAWASWQMTDYFSFKLGRQELVYDNSRLLGKSNWNQNGQTHDALLLKFDRNNLRIDIGGAFNQSADRLSGTSFSNLNESLYKTLNFLWLSKNFNRWKISSLVIADGNQKSGTNNTTYLRLTSGGSILYKKEKFNISSRAFYQNGKNIKGQDIDAFLIHGEINSKITKLLSFKGGFETKSGNNYKDTAFKKDMAFDILYGSPHVFNGSMDYFNKPITTKNAGLHDLYMGFNIKISPKSHLSIDYHYFKLQNNYIKNNTVVDKYLASEIDMDYFWGFNENAFLNLGISALKGSKSLEMVEDKGDSGKPCFWAYIMISFKPEFLNLKK